MRDLGGADFAAALDYAGIDVYVDVFGPRIGVERVAEVVGWVLRTFREQTLPIAGIPAATPIRIARTAGRPARTVLRRRRRECSRRRCARCTTSGLS
ncbi:MAG TPA: hypothetical protein VFE59_29880 [Trebonia sp.]|nr:hypothetical protein [Trebonia sp.]